MQQWLQRIQSLAQPRDFGFDDGTLPARDAWPADFQAFLRIQNGANFPEGSPIVASVPVPWNARPWIEDVLTVLYGTNDRPGDPDRGWLNITENSLPAGTVPIGRFDTSSLLVLSLRADDYGHVYYWDYYHSYPWRGDFFRNRVKKACGRWPEWEAISEDPGHPAHAALDDAIRDALLVRLAESFSEFVLSLEIGPAEKSRDR